MTSQVRDDRDDDQEEDRFDRQCVPSLRHGGPTVGPLRVILAVVSSVCPAITMARLVRRVNAISASRTGRSA